MSRRDELWRAITEVLARNVPSDYDAEVDKKDDTPKKKGKKDGKNPKK